MNGSIRTALGGLVAIAIVSSASAQSIRGFEEEGRQETRATIGITIPFGGDRRSAESKPRVDLRLQAAEIGSPSEFQLSPTNYLPDRSNVRETTLSLTFEDNPRFLVNGQAAGMSHYAHADQESGDEPVADDVESDEGEREGRTTLQKIGLGAAIAGGVVLVAGGIFIANVLHCNGFDDESRC